MTDNRHVVQSWQDQFGSVLAQFSGSGRHPLLVIAPSEIAQASLNAVQNLKSSKSTLVLAVVEELHSAPIQHAIHALEPKAVVALVPGLAGIASRGQATATTKSTHLTSTGLEYVAEGSPAWHSSAAQTGDLEHTSTVGGVTSGLGLACLVCGVDWLEAALKRLV